mmetsp:Transcript_26754/g.82303  ORF Transcript_26754/g.82303 Transcript_26754/m.82303 type:complete len:315 (-) Transcript_26754:416-1360(-)
MTARETLAVGDVVRQGAEEDVVVFEKLLLGLWELRDEVGQPVAERDVIRIEVDAVQAADADHVVPPGFACREHLAGVRGICHDELHLGIYPVHRRVSDYQHLFAREAGDHRVRVEEAVAATRRYEDLVHSFGVLKRERGRRFAGAADRGAAHDRVAGRRGDPHAAFVGERRPRAPRQRTRDDGRGAPGLDRRGVGRGRRLRAAGHFQRAIVGGAGVLAMREDRHHGHVDVARRRRRAQRARVYKVQAVRDVLALADDLGQLEAGPRVARTGLDAQLDLEHVLAVARALAGRPLERDRESRRLARPLGAGHEPLL